MTIGTVIIGEGDHITLDGATGEVICGEVPTKEASLSSFCEKLLSWADDFRRLQIRANADTPRDAENARRMGAEGIGLCRTEHMFFEEERIPLVRQMILARTEKEASESLKKLLPHQRHDFEGIFRAMNGFPVTIRFLDPPLHEFLPHKDLEIEALARDLSLSFEEVKDRVIHLSEVNPMLGNRGCRLLITMPGLLEMQTRAVLEAALQVQKEGVVALPEIMIPFIGLPEELQWCREIIEKESERVFSEVGRRVSFQIGTMIELPRACAVADEITEYADFFSFGTNDLTQMTFGFSRDDVGRFFPEYLKKEIFSRDPFESIDEKGVGAFLKMGIEKGRKKKSQLKISVCGEHGGDAESILFFHQQGVNTISCSPFRVPIARLAAAQALLQEHSFQNNEKD